tara:strand:- start:2007 stop:2234 length:228 start_codon:yes stop_codon:yes gene_type:complete
MNEWMKKRKSSSRFIMMTFFFWSPSSFQLKFFFVGGDKSNWKKLDLSLKKSHIDRALPILYRPLRRICDYLIASS